jgi:hypothetical protein
VVTFVAFLGTFFKKDMKWEKYGKYDDELLKSF